jgi:hypothetical protein
MEGAAAAEGNYSLRALNKDHNWLQGVALNKFYADFRVGEGNSFWMLVEP